MTGASAGQLTSAQTESLDQLTSAQADREPFRLLNALLQAHEAATHFEEHRDSLIKVLTVHESFETAVDEVDRSIHALQNLHRELSYLRAARVDSIAVFLPINLPLYSLVLFAAIPSIMAETVHVRAPAATPDWLQQVIVSSNLLTFFPRVRMHYSTRRSFINSCVKSASAVVFTGRFENAELVRAQCPDSLFIYEGSGPNPVIVGPGADLGATFETIIAPRLFNGGQDCAGPDAYLVHESQSDSFVTQLRSYLVNLPTGSYADHGVRIGRIMNPGPLRNLAAWLAELSRCTILGGRVDQQNAFVEPTIIVQEIDNHAELHEFFAPVFNILTYQDADQLEAWFSRREYIEQAMYISIFGEKPTRSMAQHNTVLREKTILDVEQGNTAYGGFGPKANYVSLGSRVLFVGPILISERLAAHSVALDQSREHPQFNVGTAALCYS